jgi:hypothetical protein
MQLTHNDRSTCKIFMEISEHFITASQMSRKVYVKINLSVSYSITYREENLQKTSITCTLFSL